jgi:hypothetical protein
MENNKQKKKKIKEEGIKINILFTFLTKLDRVEM